jgi:NADH-quinone oxidoreductase subunit M
VTHVVTSLGLTGAILLAWPRAGLEGVRLRVVLAGVLGAAAGVVTWEPATAALWAATVLLVGTGRDALGLLLPALGVPAAWLLQERAPALAAALWCAGLVARMAVFPLHGWWLRALSARTRPVALLVWILHPGLLATLVLRPGGSLASACPGWAPEALAVLGIVGALWASLLALVQGQLWRLLGLLAVSQAGMQLAGAMALNETAGAGAFLIVGGKGVGLVALALGVAAIKARTGTATLEQLGGLHRTMGRTSALMLLAGVMAAGFPGSLAFVAEDLLMHGIFSVHPLLMLGVLVVTALNGMAVFRAWMRVCLGSGPSPGFEVPPGRDLRARELLGIGACVLLLFAQGLVPSLSVPAREPARSSAEAH